MIDTLFLLHEKMKKQGKLDHIAIKKYVQLQTIWQDFTAYKNLEHHGAVYTVIEHIFLLSQMFLSQEKLKESALLAKNQLVQEIDTTIEINEILMRFYHLKRLAPFITLLKNLETKAIIPFDALSTLEISQLKLETTPVLYALDSLQQDQTFQEFFILWDILNQYIYLKDTRIIIEYTKALYYLFYITIKHLSHENLLLQNQITKCANLEQLHAMPLADILNLLDIMVEELPYFLEKTELNSKLTWKEWVKKYWLIAPISALILSIRVYLIYAGAIEGQHNAQS